MANYRLKLARTNNFKARVSPRIPAQLVGGSGIEVERTNAVYTVSIDYTNLAEQLALAADFEATTYVGLYESTLDDFSKISLTNLKADIEDTFDGIYQPLDATLTALAALDSTAGLLTQTGADTFVRRSLAAPAAGITITNPTGTAGNPTFALANDLAAYEGLSTNGLVTRTGDGTATTRTLTAPAAGITVSNGDGVSGNPTLALADDLAALEGMGGAGLAARTATNSWTARTLTAPAAGFTVTNPAGVAGNPTFVLANDLAALEGLASTGIARRTGSDAWSVGTAVANSELATMAAYTLKLNATGSAAVPTDTKISALTDRAGFGAGDKLMIEESTGELRKIDYNDLPGAGSLGGSTGSTDNAALRADGTGGATVQASPLIIADTTGAISRSGNGGIPVQGTNTNDSAAAGNVGEYFSSVLPIGTPIGLSSGVSANVVSISLTAGDWDVSGTAIFTGAPASFQSIFGSISTTSATHNNSADRYADITFGAFTSLFAFTAKPGPVRISLSATTTVYLVVSCTFNAGAPAAYGAIVARRAR